MQRVTFSFAVRNARGQFAAASPRIQAKAKQLFRKDVEQSFAKSRTPDGKAWPALKSRVGQPLVLTGRMRSAALRAVDAAIWKGNKLSAKIASSRVRYSKYHQFGTRHIKQRRFFGYSPASVKAIAKMVAKEAAKALKGK